MWYTGPTGVRSIELLASYRMWIYLGSLLSTNLVSETSLLSAVNVWDPSRSTSLSSSTAFAADATAVTSVSTLAVIDNGSMTEWI